MHEEQGRENRLRRMAARQGLLLMLSRRSDPKPAGLGTYILVDAVTDFVVYSGSQNRHGLTLDEVEQCLAQRTAT